MICICGFSVHPNLKVPVLPTTYITVKYKEQVVVFKILLGEYVVIHPFEVFCKHLHLLDFDFDPCVIPISVPMARRLFLSKISEPCVLRLCCLLSEWGILVNGITMHLSVEFVVDLIQFL